MIIDWRSSFVRGGSGWMQAGLVVVSVGVTLEIVPVSVPDWVTFSGAAVTGATISTPAVTGATISQPDIAPESES